MNGKFIIFIKCGNLFFQNHLIMYFILIYYLRIYLVILKATYLEDKWLIFLEEMSFHLSQSFTMWTRFQMSFLIINPG